MSETPISIESAPLPRRDTRKSWRVVGLVFVWSIAGLAALLGFFNEYYAASKGDSDAALTGFESSLRDYVRTAEQLGMLKLAHPNSDTFFFRIPAVPASEAGEESTRLENAVNNLRSENRVRAKAIVNQTIAEFNYARSGDEADLRVHSDESLAALQREWQPKNTFNAFFKGIGKGGVWGTCAWLGSLLLLLLVELAWWFFLDRIRDVSAAITGK